MNPAKRRVRWLILALVIVVGLGIFFLTRTDPLDTFEEQFEIKDLVVLTGTDGDLLIGHSYKIPIDAPIKADLYFNYPLRGRMGDFVYVINMRASSDTWGYVDVIVEESGKIVLEERDEVLRGTYLFFLDPNDALGGTINEQSVLLYLP